MADQINTIDETEVERLPPAPGTASRIDTLPQGFFQSISRRPHLPGDIIANRYKLLESLGEGGMGQVFSAENLAIGRRVAIKLLKADLLADASFRKRFQHEAMAIAAFEHRNVAHFIDLIVGDPTFLVMEYVPGPTLSAVLRNEKRLAISRAINITMRLAWALDAAHTVGVIHRDIKPGNVILAPDPELGEEPKLIDFGLAKLPTMVGAEQLTRTGQVVGTPHYMSPEQIANKDIAPWSDVYALGCLLHHMLAGQPPFADGDDVQILYQHLSKVPQPLRAHVPEAPAELEAVVRRALAKEPTERYRSMRQLAEALGASDRRSSSVPEVRGDREHTPIRSGPHVAGRIALVAIAVAVGGAGVHFAERAAIRRGGLIVITSRPPGASVDLDGQPLPDSTPTAVRGVLAGMHRVRVNQPGHDSIEQVLTLKAGERVALDVVLPPASRAIDVRTVPSGAQVFIDGLQRPGATPLTVSVSEDDFHEIRIEKLGYESETRRIVPEDRAPSISIPLRAETRPRGLLIVDSASAAEVWIDGKNSGFLTPTVGIQVSAGEHTVELRDSIGERSQIARVTIAPGETLHMTLNTGTAE